jgi:Rod binding domain-containing protein
MQINSLSHKIAAEELPLERLGSSSQLSEAEKIAGASRHFEAVLLRQFLTEAQKPVLNPKSSTGGAVGGIYQDMIVNNLADEISKSGTFGLAKYFQAQMVPPQKSGTSKGDVTTPDK